jgi:hypothetical protein
VGRCELERRLRERKRSGVKGEEEDREKGEEERGIIMRRIAFSKEKYCIEKDWVEQFKGTVSRDI